MSLDNPSSELREKVLACKTPEELLALAKDEGIVLTDTQLEEIAGDINMDAAVRHLVGHALNDVAELSDSGF